MSGLAERFACVVDLAMEAGKLALPMRWGLVTPMLREATRPYVIVTARRVRAAPASMCGNSWPGHRAHYRQGESVSSAIVDHTTLR